MSMADEGVIRPPDPRGPLGVLSRFEHHWKYGPQLYWYVTRPLWWARWRVWYWRYWRAISLLERSGAAFTQDGDPLRYSPDPQDAGGEADA